MARGKGLHRAADASFRAVTALSAGVIVAAMAGIIVELVHNSHLSLSRFGFGFLVSSAWNPVTEQYGALSSIFGTLMSTVIAMVIAIPLSLMIALFLVELAPPLLGKLAGQGIELLAAVPSIIFGMWGLFSFAPFMADHVQPALQKGLGFLPVFQGPPMGIGLLTAGIILAFMVVPFIAAVMRDVLQMVPAVLKESAYGMGATTWEVSRKVTMRYGLRGLVGGVLLGLGRAIGETMAVTFVIGNGHRISASLFAAGNSIASALANEFAEASTPMYLSSLVELGLVLFGISLVIQVGTQLWLARLGRAAGEGR
jgi:phosphate transport system permease protein